MENILDLMSDPSFNSDVLKRYLLRVPELLYTRTYAYARAKEFRALFPDSFARVIKVADWYFVILDKDKYNIYWEARKLAIRNERRLKNETL